jgi:hypothetical protein
MALTAIGDHEVTYSSTPFVPRIWLISGATFIGQLIFIPGKTGQVQRNAGEGRCSGGER